MNSPFNRFTPLSGTTMFGSELNTETLSAIIEAGVNVSGNTLYQYGNEPNIASNQGVFRVYWTPKSSARYLQNDLSGYYKGAYNGTYEFSGVIGPAYQIFAQGYNCSAPLSGIIPANEQNTSAVAPDLLKLSRYTDPGTNTLPDALWTSGFYYCSEMLEENPTQTMVDESAARTFANSQNASVGMSGRPRKVTLLRSRSDAADNRGSEAYNGDASGSLGFKSAAIFDLKRDN